MLTEQEGAGLSPATARCVFGHEAAEYEFLSAWNSGRFHHAWLLGGIRGIGKATFAYRVARFLLTRHHDDIAESLDVAPDHPIWRQVSQGAHPDFRLVEKSWDEKRKRRRSEIVVDDVRVVGSFLSKTSGTGGWRVVLIDAADEMNRNAANAVLKVLEEPPKRTVLLLLAHNTARLLPTIRSRCRKVSFRPLEQERLEELLQQHQPQLSMDDVHSLAALAEGSAGRAISLAQSGGLPLYQSLMSLLRSLPKLDVPAAHALIDSALKNEDGFRTVSQLLLWWLGRAISAGGRGVMPIEILPGENGLIRVLLSGVPLDRWGEAWEKMSQLFESADPVALDKKQVLLSAFSLIERTMRPS